MEIISAISLFALGIVGYFVYNIFSQGSMDKLSYMGILDREYEEENQTVKLENFHYIEYEYKGVVQSNIVSHIIECHGEYYILSMEKTINIRITHLKKAKNIKDQQGKELSVGELISLYEPVILDVDLFSMEGAQALEPYRKVLARIKPELEKMYQDSGYQVYPLKKYIMGWNQKKARVQVSTYPKFGAESTVIPGV